jgi:uncharacterized protein YbjQ (UPF0145 family)
MLEQLLPLLITLAALALGLSVGYFVEQRHFRSLSAREAQYREFIVTNLKTVPAPTTAKHSLLVVGDAVIAADYFKSFAARLRNIVGGEVRTFNSLMLRARREARLRMLAQARRAGATEVHNVRYETSNIRSSGRNSAAVSVEVFAFGTAVVRA